MLGKGSGGGVLSIDQYEVWLGTVDMSFLRLGERATLRGLESEAICVCWYGTVRVALRLMGDAGLRVGEVVRVDWSVVRLGATACGLLRLPAGVCKGGRAREVPASAALRLAVEDLAGWWVRAFSEEPSGLVVCGADRVRGVDVRTVRRWVAVSSGDVLRQHVHPHELRHVFGRRVRRVSDVSVAQRLLGHANLATTQRYTEATEDEAVAAIAAMGASK